MMENFERGIQILRKIKILYIKLIKMTCGYLIQKKTFKMMGSL